MGGTELSTDSNATTPYDVSRVVISDGYTDGYWATITSTSAEDRIGLDTWDLKGVPQQFNGIVGVSPVTITPTTSTTAILISNPYTNNANTILSVSFNGGTTYFDIERKGVFTIETEITSFKIKGSVASTNYQIVLTHK